jgi:peptidoglycan/LPS O-acetylase OafA/YrhL
VRKLGPRFLASFSLALCILIPVARAVAFHYGHFQGGEWYTWFTADGLAAGSLLAIALRGSISRKRAAIGAAFLMTTATIMLIASAPFGMLSRQTMLGASLQLTLVNTFFAGLLLLFMMVGSGSRKGLVNSSVLQFFGYISYGLYLIHLLVFQTYDIVTRKFWPWLQPTVGHFDLILLRFAIVSAAAVSLAYISRKYYEEWFLRLKDRPAAPPAEEPAETSVKVIVTAPAASGTAREASESF